MSAVNKMLLRIADTGRSIYLVRFFLVAVFLSGAYIPNGEAADSRDILVQEVDGTAFYQKQAAGDWLSLDEGMVIHQFDKVKTEEDTTLKLLFKGQSNATVVVRPQAVIELSTVGEADEGDDTELDLYIGSVLVKAEKLKGESKFKVRTPHSIVGIRGTEFEVSVD